MTLATVSGALANHRRPRLPLRSTNWKLWIAPPRDADRGIKEPANESRARLAFHARHDRRGRRRALGRHGLTNPAARRRRRVQARFSEKTRFALPSAPAPSGAFHATMAEWTLNSTAG